MAKFEIGKVESGRDKGAKVEATGKFKREEMREPQHKQSKRK